jgi:hypothetical protein
MPEVTSRHHKKLCAKYTVAALSDNELHVKILLSIFMLHGSGALHLIETMNTFGDIRLTLPAIRVKSCILVFGVTAGLLVGCSTPFQGLKFRGQSPPIEDAYKKLALALQVDGYEMLDVNPKRFSLETSWRPLKEKEKSEGDLKLTEARIESKLAVRLEKRGSLYDVFLTPSLRYDSGGMQKEVVADIHHPLWVKWRTVLSALLQMEAREEE